MSNIKLRIVPKSRMSGISNFQLLQTTPGNAKLFAPTEEQTQKAEGALLEMGLDVTSTPHGGLETEIKQEDLGSLFKTSLKKADEIGTPLQTKGLIHHFNDEGLIPDSNLQIPENLASFIDYAYVPNSVTLFDDSFVAPKENGVYYLTLGEVANAIQTTACHRQGILGQNVRVAMTDTGFANHPFFQRGAYNITRTHETNPAFASYDPESHGTGESANVLVNAPACEFVGVKFGSSLASTLETALDTNPHIVTNSWGLDYDHVTKRELELRYPNYFAEVRELEIIINQAIDNGVVMVFSAGNGHKAFPACMPNVISVGGATVNPDGSLKASSYASSFKSKLYRGRTVPDVCGVVGEAAQGQMPGHIMLPVPENSKLAGENMTDQDNNKGWGIFSGTSASGPQVAGVAALLRSVNENLTPQRIKEILASTAVDVTRGQTSHGSRATEGDDLATGAGFVNALSACNLAVEIDPDFEL